MIRTALVVAFSVGLPLAARADSWKDAPLLPENCVEKHKAAPDKHTTKCALECANGNALGILVVDKFLKFDEAGSKLARAELAKTKKKDHLRVDVTGKKDGETIHVETVKLR